MKQNLFTMIFPVNAGQQGALRRYLLDLNYKGEPSENDPLGFAALDMLHYAAVFIFDDPVEGWLLVFESNIDGDIPDYLRALIDEARRKDAGRRLLGIFRHCAGFEQGGLEDLAGYFENHLQSPSAAYSGCVGRTRKQIILEAEIHDRASEVLNELEAAGEKRPDEAAAARAVHEALSDDARFTQIAAIPEDTPEGRGLMQAHSLVNRVKPIPDHLRYLRVFIARIVRALFAALFRSGPVAFFKGCFALVLFVILALWNQIRKEPSAAADTWRPDPAHVRTQKVFEDYYPSNHMVSIVTLHTDTSRRWAKWSAFVLLNMLARYVYNKGLLGVIPSIHFAHWSVVCDQRRLLFVSNFDGSWDSYLDDFTLKASRGLTMAWAHSKGFPVSKFMLLGGAAHGPEFIDWARRSMVPTLVWYSAYPRLSVRNINRNTALRQAIVRDKNRINAGNWLDLVQ